MHTVAYSGSGRDAQSLSPNGRDGTGRVGVAWELTEQHMFTIWAQDGQSARSHFCSFLILSEQPIL